MASVPVTKRGSRQRVVKSKKHFAKVKKTLLVFLRGKQVSTTSKEQTKLSNFASMNDPKEEVFVFNKDEDIDVYDSIDEDENSEVDDTTEADTIEADTTETDIIEVVNIKDDNIEVINVEDDKIEVVTIEDNSYSGEDDKDDDNSGEDANVKDDDNDGNIIVTCHVEVNDNIKDDSFIHNKIEEAREALLDQMEDYFKESSPPPQESVLNWTLDGDETIKENTEDDIETDVSFEDDDISNDTQDDDSTEENGIRIYYLDDKIDEKDKIEEDDEVKEVDEIEENDKIEAFKNMNDSKAKLNILRKYKTLCEWKEYLDSALSR